MATSDGRFQLYNSPSPGATGSLMQLLYEHNDYPNVNTGIVCPAGGTEPCPGYSSGPTLAMDFVPHPSIACSQPQLFQHQTGSSAAEHEGSALHGPQGMVTADCPSQAQDFPMDSEEFMTSLQLANEEPSGANRRRGRKAGPRVPDLQQKLEALTEQFQQLSRENVFMRNTQKILETLVSSRVRSAGLLAKLQSLAQGQPSQAGPATDLLAVPRPVPPAEPAPGVPPDLEFTWSEARAEVAMARLKLASSRAGVRAGERSAVPQHSEAAASSEALLVGKAARSGKARKGPSDAPLVVAMCPGPDGEAPPMSPEVVKQLQHVTSEEFCMLWKHVCPQLAMLLVGAEAHGVGSPPYLRLERYLERFLIYAKKVLLISPTCFLESLYKNVETGQPEQPSEYFWVSCARALQLNSQQLRDAVSLASMHERNVAPVVQQRQQLAAQLSSGLAAVVANAPKTCKDMANRYCVDEMARQLERSAFKEHQTHMYLTDFLCTSVLTPLQVAKSVVVAYPYIPDNVALLHAAKVLSGDSGNQLQQPANQRAPNPNPAAAATALPALGSSSGYGCG
ncbi:hypothetical protein Agub_g10108 [Astrephomene gubernaculifera]|uniref:Uncharacterized protein n=1 Tax=Astrephomene gubernaculifera TaxID=47775 RepID=A0AAD3HPU2_9CHLO|nr:hypothetical protein Agub_g10108 [Astrephomene gubernaculifera]